MKWLAALKAEDEIVKKFGEPFKTVLAAFEGAVRSSSDEDRLVLASALTASVKRRLLVKCGSQKGDTAEEMARIDGLHQAVHDLDAMGGRLEKRIVADGKVVGVGKMTTGDVSKGS